MKEEDKKKNSSMEPSQRSQTQCNGEAKVVNADIETMYVNIRV